MTSEDGAQEQEYLTSTQVTLKAVVWDKLRSSRLALSWGPEAGRLSPFLTLPLTVVCSLGKGASLCKPSLLHL